MCLPWHGQALPLRRWQLVAMKLCLTGWNLEVGCADRMMISFVHQVMNVMSPWSTASMKITMGCLICWEALLLNPLGRFPRRDASGRIDKHISLPLRRITIALKLRSGEGTRSGPITRTTLYDFNGINRDFHQITTPFWRRASDR